jgi:transcriptional regulator with XRE-family HTH domain
MTKTKSLAARRFELMAAEYLERMGARIRDRREELGLTQDDVARRMPGKITHNRISLWERGKNRPRDDALESLAGVLGVPVSYFMMSEPDKTKTPDLAGVMAPDESRSQLDAIERKLDMILAALALIPAPDEDARKSTGSLLDALPAEWRPAA